MSQYSKEKEAEFLAMVRLVIVKQPHLSGLQVTDILNKQGIRLYPDYVRKLLKKISGERLARINTEIVAKEIAKYEDLVLVLSRELWKIISNPMAGNKDKNVAIKTMADIHSNLLDKKFDAGIFERQLGKLKAETQMSEEQENYIKQALAYVFNPDRPQKFIEQNSDRQIIEGEVSGN
jgi:hypothetical protein